MQLFSLLPEMESDSVKFYLTQQLQTPSTEIDLPYFCGSSGALRVRIRNNVFLYIGNDTKKEQEVQSGLK